MRHRGFNSTSRILIFFIIALAASLAFLFAKENDCFAGISMPPAEQIDPAYSPLILADVNDDPAVAQPIGRNVVASDGNGSISIASGVWSGNGLTFTVKNGRIKNLSYGYAKSCSKCNFNIGSIPIVSGTFSFKNTNAGIALTGSFTDRHTMSANLSIKSPGCKLASQGVGGFPKYVGTIINSFAYPGGYAVGLAFDNNDDSLWIADALQKKIYKVDTSGNIITSFIFPGDIPSGVVFDGKYLWISETLDNWNWQGSPKIYKVDDLGNVAYSFESPGPGPIGLAYDGTHLWIADVIDNRIYETDLLGNVIDSFTAPTTSNAVTGYELAYDGKYLWFRGNEYDYKKIYKLDTSGNVVATFKALDRNISEPNGLTFDGIYLWASFGNQIVKMEIY
jgi:hypothetical protein